MKEAKFSVGQIITHKLFNYRGVIIDVDFNFLGSEEWYEKVARSRPPKDQPWYHILVDNTTQQTYVAERNLKNSGILTPVNHPEVETNFNNLENGHYVQRARKN
jgi:heat shock protein HspQ